MTWTETTNRRRGNQCGQRRIRLIGLCGSIGLMVLIAATCLAGPAAGGGTTITRFRMGTPKDFFGPGSPNDTKAAITVWAKNILGQNPVTDDSRLAMVFDSADEMIKAYESREIDGMTLIPQDFFKVRSRPANAYFMQKNLSTATRYALLVNRSGGIEDVRQLKGRKVSIYSGQSMGLATPWLDTLLASRSMGLSQNVFGEVKRIDAASRAILQVFFRQFDACVVALDMYKTAAELNPQVEKDVKPLAVSQELIPTFFFLHPQYDSSNHKAVDEAIAELDKTAAGRQVLTVFQADKLVKLPVSALDGTFAMLAEHERIRHGHALGGKQPQLSQTPVPGRN
jgi:hypothetical protein